jgi:hypothetical protein
MSKWNFKFYFELADVVATIWKKLQVRHPYKSFRAALFVYKNINAQNVKSVLDMLKLVGLVLLEKIGCTLS